MKRYQDLTSASETDSTTFRDDDQSPPQNNPYNVQEAKMVGKGVNVVGEVAWDVPKTIISHTTTEHTLGENGGNR